MIHLHNFWHKLINDFYYYLREKMSFLVVPLLFHPYVKIQVNLILLLDHLTKLDWIEIIRYNTPAGEVLAAFELLKEEPPEPPVAERPFTHKIVPKDIAPKLQKKTMEVSGIILAIYSSCHKMLPSCATST